MKRLNLGFKTRWNLSRQIFLTNDFSSTQKLAKELSSTQKFLEDFNSTQNQGRILAEPNVCEKDYS